MKNIKMLTLTVVAMFISATLFAGDNKKNEPVKKDADMKKIAEKENCKDVENKNPNYKNGYYRHHDKDKDKKGKRDKDTVNPPEPEVFSFVGSWDGIISNPFFWPYPMVYVVKDDGTCENWCGGTEPTRVGTWEVGADGIVYVTWDDGNSAILVFLDADNMTGTSGDGISTITLTRQ